MLIRTKGIQVKLHEKASLCHHAIHQVILDEVLPQADSLKGNLLPEPQVWESKNFLAWNIWMVPNTSYYLTGAWLQACGVVGGSMGSRGGR